MKDIIKDTTEEKSTVSSETETDKNAEKAAEEVSEVETAVEEAADGSAEETSDETAGENAAKESADETVDGASVDDITDEKSDDPVKCPSPRRVAEYVLGLLLIAAAAVMITAALRIWRETQTGGPVYAKQPWYEQYVPEEVDIRLPDKDGSTMAVRTAVPVTGSSAKEFAAGGLIAAEDDAFFYIADPSEGGHVYSVSKKDRSRTLLSELPADEICLAEGRLYMSCRSSGDAAPGLYACDTDGRMQELILSGGVRSMKAEGGFLYYIRCRDGRMCSYDCAKGTQQILSDKECVNMIISGEMIYYIARDDDREEGSDRVICRMDIHGGSRMNLTVHGAYGDIGYMDEKIVYVIYDEGYGLIDPATDITLPAADLEKSFVKMQGLYSLPAESDGCLWYIDRSRDRQLVKADIESGDEEELNIYGVDRFCIMKDCFIINRMENGTELCIASFMKEGYGAAALFEGELR